MYTQRDPLWKDILMGEGAGTIGEYGCYLVSLCNGLIKFGYAYTPLTLNTYLKDKKLWTGTFKNYIDTVHCVEYAGALFVGYSTIVPWSDLNQLLALTQGPDVILGRVNAAAIGGQGNHFVHI